MIIIGDLEFELHRPTYCKPTESKQEDIIIDDNCIETIDAEVHENEDNKDDCEVEEIEPLNCEVEEIDMDPAPTIEELPRNIKRSKVNINYNENHDDDDELENNLVVKIKRPVRRSRRKNGKRNRKIKKIIKKNTPNSHLDDEEDDTESDDAIMKQIGVSIKKPRKNYSKLPKTVACTMCDSMFGTERTLKIHMNLVHGIKERYICPICSREFKIGGNLKQHIETHSDYKRFICNYCGKGFHLPYNLKEHMNTHTGAR